MAYTYYRRYQPRRTVPSKGSHFGSFFSLVLFLLLLGLALRACVSIVTQLTTAKQDEAVLSLAQGSAEVLVWGHESFMPASDAQIILLGDEVKTNANGFAALKFINGTEVLLGPNTHVLLEDLDPEAELAMTLELKQGSVLMKQVPDDQGETQVKIQTNLLDVFSVKASYLLEFTPEKEAVYILDGEAIINYMDRTPDSEVLVDTRTLQSKQSSVFDTLSKQNFLARLDVELVQAVQEDLLLNSLVQWGQKGLLVAESEPLMQEEAPIIEELPAVEEEIPLQVRILTPRSPFVLDGSAVAIEGSLLGEAQKVTVSWSGTGVAYPLSLFEPGSSSFRYVADANYGNIQPGENRYTIVAYAEDGTPSEPVTVVIEANY